jgi:hypothetical protein
MTPKKFLDALSENHDKLAKSAKLIAALHREAVKSSEFNGDYRGAAISKQIANAFDDMAGIHNHVEQLGSTAAAAVDHWRLAGQTIDEDGNPTGKASKVVPTPSRGAGSYRDLLDGDEPKGKLEKTQSVTEQFFDRYFPTRTPALNAGTYQNLMEE